MKGSIAELVWLTVNNCQRRDDHEHTYDRANRVTTRTYTMAAGRPATPSVSFFYDGKRLGQQQTPNYAKGKLTKVTFVRVRDAVSVV